ncbi:MAG TPA: diguanylate cyclase [Terriglobales bacterium]|nr:diguanylate cyclase [Terriglobales bacterium]
MNSGPLFRPVSVSPETKGVALDSVLIAEDDPIFRHLLQNWLQRWNYRVIAVENGTDAWNALQMEGAPQMAILDWMMPGIDGVEICRRIRHQGEGPYRYTLLLTAKDNKQDIVTGLEAGADDYLTKPFDVDELRARVRSGKRILELQDELLCAHQALQYEAAHDPLTGLWNRGAILNLLRGESDRHQRTGSPLGVMMMDLDHFKQINDTFGHLAGDRVLQEVSRRLKDSLRSYDFVGRYGGEEFLILVPGCGPEDLAASAERLRATASDPVIETLAGPVRSTLSIGIVSASATLSDPSEYESLLRTSDAALYRAKAGGRNRVEVGSLFLAASNG